MLDAIFVFGDSAILDQGKGEVVMPLAAAAARIGCTTEVFRKYLERGWVRPCGTWERITLFRVGEIDDFAATRTEFKRRIPIEPIHWRGLGAFRKRLARGKHVTCAACGTDRDIHFHHVVPVQVDHTLAYDEDNLIPLCSLDHIRLGHGAPTLAQGRSYYNPKVREHAAGLLGNPRRRVEMETEARRCGVLVFPEDLFRERIVSPPPTGEIRVVVGSREELAAGKGDVACTVALAAWRLGVTKARVYQLITLGKLRPCSMIGRVMLYRASDVDALRVGRYSASERRRKAAFSRHMMEVVRKSASMRRAAGLGERF